MRCWWIIIWCSFVVGMETPPTTPDGSSFTIEMPEQAEVFNNNNPEMDEEEQLCNFALTVYFHNTKVSFHMIFPYLKEKIRRAKLSNSAQERAAVEVLKELFNGKYVKDTKKLSYLQSLILQATANALEAKNKESLFHMQEAENRVTKRNVALISAATGIITTAITAMVSLLINFTAS